MCINVWPRSESRMPPLGAGEMWIGKPSPSGNRKCVRSVRSPSGLRYTTMSSHNRWHKRSCSASALKSSNWSRPVSRWLSPTCATQSSTTRGDGKRGRGAWCAGEMWLPSQLRGRQWCGGCPIAIARELEDAQRDRFRWPSLAVNQDPNPLNRVGTEGHVAAAVACDGWHVVDQDVSVAKVEYLLHPFLVAPVSATNGTAKHVVTSVE